MKRCNRCQQDYPDQVMFCTKCGNPLVAVGNAQPNRNVCTKCGSVNDPQSAFCVKCGAPFHKVPAGNMPGGNMQAGRAPAGNMPGGNMQAGRAPGRNMQTGNMYAGNMQGGNMQTGQKGDSSQNTIKILIGVIGAMVAILCVVVIIFVLKKNGDTEATNGSGKTPQKVESTQTERKQEIGQADAGQADAGQADAGQADSASENTSQDLSVFQQYYDQMSDRFAKLLISDVDSGKVSTLKDSLGAALTGDDYNNAKYNYDKLTELENQIKGKSKSEIKTLKKKIKKLEKKSYASAAKKDAEYKKNKSLAEDEIAAENYKKAKTYYRACIDKLNEAKTNEVITPSGSGGSSSKDSWYEVNTRDENTHNEVYYSYMSPDYVAGMSKEQRRYYMNTLFAAYGYRFNNSTIQNYFNNQTWYSADYSISPGDQEAIKRKFDDMCRYNYDLLKQ